jgi:hypothetical protein
MRRSLLLFYNQRDKINSHDACHKLAMLCPVASGCVTSDSFRFCSTAAFATVPHLHSKIYTNIQNNSHLKTFKEKAVRHGSKCRVVIFSCISIYFQADSERAKATDRTIASFYSIVVFTVLRL